MKKKRTIVALTLVIAMVLAVGSISFAGYSDVKDDHWANSYIKDMSDKGILTGYPDGTFKPNNTVTYAEFIKMMVTAGGDDPGVSATGHWATNYYNKAVESGLIHELYITSKMLNKDIPRGYMAYIISNGLGEFEAKNYIKIKDEITDVDVDTDFEYDIIKSYEKGILTGYPDGSFKPEGTLTRAESAIVVSKYMAEKSGDVVTEPKPNNPTTPDSQTPVTPDPVAPKVDWYDLGQVCLDYHGSKPILELATNWNEGYSSESLKTIKCPINAENVKYYEIFDDCPYIWEYVYIWQGKITKEKQAVGGYPGFLLKNDGNIIEKNITANMVLIKDKKLIVFDVSDEWDKRFVSDLNSFMNGDKDGNFFSCMNYPQEKQYPLDFDYMGFFTPSGDTLICIANPFK